MTPRRMNQVLWAFITLILIAACALLYIGNKQLTSVAHQTAQLKAEVEASNKQIATYQVTKAKVATLGYVNDLANKVLPPDKEQSAIVAELSHGAGVVTTRGHVHWVVTEYGAVNLHALSLRERADALISIAHPDVREELRRDAQRLRK